MKEPVHETPLSILRTICSRKSTESLPLSPQGLINHGSISIGPSSLNTSTEQIQQPPSKDKQSSTGKDDEPQNSDGMSWKRKLLFFASFHTWILYVATFLWIIPCREPICKSPQDWKYLLHNVDITTNLAVFKSLGLGDLLIFGYSDSTEDALRTHLIALSSKDGSKVWDITVIGNTKKVLCNTGEIGSCLAMSKNSLTMFNAANGRVLWCQMFSAAVIEDMSIAVHSCGLHDNRSMTVYAVGLEKLSRQNMDRVILTVAESSTGLIRLHTASAPCVQLPLKIAQWTKRNYMDLVLICQKGNDTDIIILPEEFTCPSRDSMDMENSYVPLYKFDNANVNDSLLLVTKAGLLIALTDRVIMFSKNYTKRWEIRFPGFIVTHVIEGRFLKKNANHLVLGVKSSNSYDDFEIILIDLLNGYKNSRSYMGTGNLKALTKIKGEFIDFVLIQTEEMKLYKNGSYHTVFQLINLSMNGASITVLKSSNIVVDAVAVSVTNDIRLQFIEQTTNESLTVIGHVLYDADLRKNPDFRMLCSNCDKICI